MKMFLATIAVLLSLGCASTEKRGAEVGPRYSDKEYNSIFLDHTKSEKRYDGFYQLYEVHATMMDSNIQTAILQRQSDIYQWNAEKARTERDKLFQEASNSTKFIVVLFTPNHKANDLSKGNSMWRLYLDVNGQRYTGEITKKKGIFEDVEAMYPTYNRFSIPYEVTFSLPASALETQKSKLTLTSALGTSVLQFP